MARQGPTIRAASRTTKKAAAAKKAAPRGPERPTMLDSLTDEQKQFISDTTMTYPGGCDNGKRKFLKKLGLPDPPRYYVFGGIRIRLLDSDVRMDGTYAYLSKKGYDRLVAEIKGILPDGYTFDPGKWDQHAFFINNDA